MRESNERRILRGAAMAFAMVAALAAPGCGTARTKRGLTNAQFIVRADAVCQAERAKLAYVRRRAGALGQALIARSLIRKEVAISRAASGALEALGVPPGHGAIVEKWLTARTVAASVAGAVAEAPVNGDAAAVRDLLAELPRARARARSLAAGYGFRVCDATE